MSANRRYRKAAVQQLYHVLVVIRDKIESGWEKQIDDALRFLSDDRRSAAQKKITQLKRQRQAYVRTLKKEDQTSGTPLYEYRNALQCIMIWSRDFECNDNTEGEYTRLHEEKLGSLSSLYKKIDEVERSMMDHFPPELLKIRYDFDGWEYSNGSPIMFPSLMSDRVYDYSIKRVLVDALTEQYEEDRRCFDE